MKLLFLAFALLASTWSLGQTFTGYYFENFQDGTTTALPARNYATWCKIETLNDTLLLVSLTTKTKRTEQTQTIKARVTETGPGFIEFSEVYEAGAYFLTGRMESGAVSLLMSDYINRRPLFKTYFRR